MVFVIYKIVVFSIVWQQHVDLLADMFEGKDESVGVELIKEYRSYFMHSSSCKMSWNYLWSLIQVIFIDSS